MPIGRAFPLAAVALVAACSSGSSAASDAGPATDLTVVDVVGAVDAVDVVDVAKPVDAPEVVDVVEAPDVVDAAVDAPDAVDAPAGPVTVAVALPCTDTADNVYVTPAGLPILTPAMRGDVVRCTVDPAQSQSTVEANLRAANVEGVSAEWAVDVYRIAFRTMRNTVAEGMSSARVYLPHGAVGPRPLVVVAHPSEGLADSCATSRRPDTLRDLALPWAARGYPVIAPDYAGLGTDGTQGYLDNRDTAQSLLDGARALRKLLAPGSLSSRIVLVGHSQGGGAVLAAQSIARAYGADGEVAAAVVYAPEWPSRIDSFRVLNALQHPDSLTISYGITTPVVVTSMAFAFYENHVGMGRGGEAFPANLRVTNPASLNSLCLIPYGGYIQGLALHVRDWLDEPIRTGFVACSADPTAAACTGTGRAFYQYVHDNLDLAQGDPAGAPVFYVQGMADIVMPPAQEAACNTLLLRRTGVDVELCTDDVASHTNVSERNSRHAIAWAEARLAGTAAPPPCTGPALPACDP